MAEPRSAPRASLGGGGDVRGHLGENVSAESLSESAGDDESVSVAAVLVLPSGGATAAAAAAEVVLQQVRQRLHKRWLPEIRPRVASSVRWSHSCLDHTLPDVSIGSARRQPRCATMRCC